MPYQATVVNVMIASPGDVSDERDVARAVISDWNYIHSTVNRTILVPVGWETHAAPAMGDRPQEIINQRLLADCDLLIGIFWTRLGTPTGAAASGTVEEIERHLAAKKPAMLYFSSKPVVPQSIDVQQLEAVHTFRGACEKRGLLGTFDSTADFRDRFMRDLQITLRDDPYLRNVISSPLSAVVGTPTIRQGLSQEARNLLVAAAVSDDGALLKLATVGGRFVQVNGTMYGGGSNPRATARWLFAVDQLAEEGLIEDRSGKGEIFFVTELGYQKAEEIDSPQRPQ